MVRDKLHDIIELMNDGEINKLENSMDLIFGIEKYGYLKKMQETKCINQDEMIHINQYLDISVDINEFEKKAKSKKQKIKFEESHSKRTLWISRENNKLLDIESKNGGNITKEVNSALTLWFNLKAKGLVE